MFACRRLEHVGRGFHDGWRGREGVGLAARGDESGV